MMRAQGGVRAIGRHVAAGRRCSLLVSLRDGLLGHCSGVWRV